jgi:hypothetical protein
MAGLVGYGSSDEEDNLDKNSLKLEVMSIFAPFFLEPLPISQIQGSRQISDTIFKWHQGWYATISSFQ